MNSQSIPVVKNMIRTMTYKNSSEFIKSVLEQSTTADITDLVRNTYGDIISKASYME